MTSIAHSDLAAILAAIRAEPDDDTPRLVLADWLDEGTDPAWAEFIRVQVELARMVVPMIETHLVQFPSTRICVGLVNRSIELPTGLVRFKHQQRDDSWYESEEVKIGKVEEFDSARVKVHFVKVENLLRARSDALLAEHEPRWRGGAKCDQPPYAWRCDRGIARHPRKDVGGMDVTCSYCRGTGWSRWWLAEQITRTDPSRSTATARRITTWRHRVHFERGLIEQVDANLADIFDEQGKAAEWALACVRGEPGLRRFGVVDKEPADRGEINERWYWFKMNQLTLLRDAELDDPTEMSYLPTWLFECLPGTDTDTIGMPYKSEAAANRALAEAAWQCVREQISG